MSMDVAAFERFVDVRVVHVRVLVLVRVRSCVCVCVFVCVRACVRVVPASTLMKFLFLMQLLWRVLASVGCIFRWVFFCQLTHEIMREECTAS